MTAQRPPHSHTHTHTTLNNNTAAPHKHTGYADPVRFLSRVIEKGGDWVKLERPLPVDVRGNWLPELHKFLPMLDGGTGLEGLSVRFPWSPYKGHFTVGGRVGGAERASAHVGRATRAWGCA